MKNTLLALLLGMLLFSCQQNQNPDISDMPQEWALIGYKSGWIAQEDITPIKDSVYNYRLETDGSFVKTIGQFRLTGTYDFRTFEDGQYVYLSYDEASIKLDEERSRIHYCGQHYEPFLIIDSKTIRGSWSECDGPNLYFERK